MVFNMTIKAKILILSIFTVLASSFSLTLLNVVGVKNLSEKNIVATRERMMDIKKQEVKQFTDLASSAIKDILDTTDDSIRQESLAKRINNLRFGEDGYFFAYSGDGVVTAHATASLIGQNLLSLKSKNGVAFIRELIAAAKRGGDYVLYNRPKLNQEGQFMKLGYAIWIPEVKWMIGTSFYIDDIDDVIAELRVEQSKKINSAIVSTILISGIIATILIVLSLALINTIVRPLKRITHRLNDIASENGDLTQRLDASTNDELGALARAFNLFVDKVHSLVKKTAETAESVNDSATNSQNLSNKITQSVNNQRMQTDMVATAMNEMSASAQEVSNNASEAARSADAANTSCNSAKDVVANSIHSVKSLVNEIERASTVINDLKGDVGEIVTVLDVIRGIAEQTNLLALNAAIEAARAGEQGRGFAVVADEVRTLASRTQDSTKEIQEMIERLQKGSEEAVNVMISSKTVGEETVEHSSSAGSSLDDIALSVSAINSMNAQIANAAREQSQVGESINENLTRILTESDVTTEATSDSHKTSSDLASKATELSSLIHQFKI
ncbi:MAG: methyl-accepting chemotaxis protein [Candidatus Endobugula sp.]|jgi:methyl-accepting chemotaxis protein